MRRAQWNPLDPGGPLAACRLPLDGRQRQRQRRPTAPALHHMPIPRALPSNSAPHRARRPP
ncbi:hypothetical protein BURPSS13_P0540 [Burkholderia pseudomallei S13]|nr:hypothetical protein BURPSS13_P0540 [Burkholderia pseudomallei S13]